MTALAVLVVASVGYGLLHGRTTSKWETRVEVALTEARVQKARAETFAELADSALAEIETAKGVTTERVRVVRERVVEIREVEVPAIAQPFVAARDSVIDELLVAFDEVDEILTGYVTVVEFLRQESWAYQVRGDSLEAVLVDRPRPRRWWVPQVGVGGFTGVCDTGGLCKGVGLTLSWRTP